jgi:hypothetical protein
MAFARSVVRLVAALSFFVAGGAAIAAEPARPAAEKSQKETGYLRLVRDKSDRPMELDTAVVRFAPADGRGTPTVDLVAAVHVGDGKYYDQLNRRFRQYDTVLYELVAAAGTKVPEGKEIPANNPISFVQKTLRDVLELQFQLERVQYNRPNMVHADMSPTQLAEAMRERGESVWTILMRTMIQSMAQQNTTSGGDVQLLMALFDRNRSLALKRVMAEQFQGMEGTLAALGGAKGSSLIEGRNGVALRVLREKLDAGQRKIAIFYGAGHMRDFEKRLRADFGMTPSKTEWITAWDMH